MKKYLYILIIAIGLLQTIGYLSRIKIIKQLGQITCSSPLPIVFTEVKGVETFASDFYIEFINYTGEREVIKITPNMYSKLKGPYNRRNIFGAAISYGPILKKEIWETIFKYGFCKKKILEEMMLPLNGNNYSVRIKTKTAGRNNEWVLQAPCNK